MPKTPAQKKFEVMVDFKLTVGVQVDAGSLEEALEQGRKLKIQDCISFEGNNYIDSSDPVLQSVWEQS